MNKEVVKLNLGCGTNILQGYRNFDMYPSDPGVEPLDLNKFPYHFPQGYADEIVLSHVLEHLIDPYRVVMECHRILKPGGKFVVVLPCTLRSSLPHLRMGHGKDYFKPITRPAPGVSPSSQTRKLFNVTVRFNRRKKFLYYLVVRWFNLRDWIHRQLYDDITYIMRKV